MTRAADRMSFLARRRAERLYREGGWGPLLTWPVERPGRAALVFQLRLPVTNEFVDLETLAARSPGAPALVAQGAQAVAAADAALGTILAGALYGVDYDDRPELLATITVALGDLDEPGALPEEGEHTDAEARTHTRISRLSDRAVEIERKMLIDMPDRGEPTPMVALQFLMLSGYGPMSITFATAHEAMMGEFGRSVFRKIAEMGYIGEQPQPY